MVWQHPCEIIHKTGRIWSGRYACSGQGGKCKYGEYCSYFIYSLHRMMGSVSGRLLFLERNFIRLFVDVIAAVWKIVTEFLSGHPDGISQTFGEFPFSETVMDMG